MAKQGDVPPPGLGKLNANKHETLSRNKVNLKQTILPVTCLTILQQGN